VTWAVNVRDFPKTDGLERDDESVVVEAMLREKSLVALIPAALTLTVKVQSHETVGVPLMVVVVPGPAPIVSPAGNEGGARILQVDDCVAVSVVV
jgi:hypothetical protein